MDLALARRPNRDHRCAKSKKPLAIRSNKCIYTFIMTFDLNTLEAKTRQVAVGCSCGNLRRASRAVTQLYDGVLQASGLKATQFTLLVAAAELKSAPFQR